MIPLTEVRRAWTEYLSGRQLLSFGQLKCVMPRRDSRLEVRYVDKHLAWGFRQKLGMEINYTKLPEKNVKMERGRHVGIES